MLRTPAPGLLLIVEVEIADDAVEQIHVLEDDEPRALAQSFVKAHSLDAGFGDQLAAQIQAQVDDERARLRARHVAAGAAAPAGAGAAGGAGARAPRAPPFSPTTPTARRCTTGSRAARRS